MTTTTREMGELDVANLEHGFFQAGWDDGFEHGELHGLFDGRALGREHAFTLWRELGYYDGAAKLWGAVLRESTSEKADRPLASMQALESTISTFPKHNSRQTADDMDMEQMLSAIRSKAKSALATLGMRTLVATSSSNGGSESKESLSI